MVKSGAEKNSCLRNALHTTSVITDFQTPLYLFILEIVFKPGKQAIFFFALTKSEQS